MIEPGDDAGQVAHAIAIAVLKRARIDLIDHSAAPPLGHHVLHFGAMRLSERNAEGNRAVAQAGNAPVEKLQPRSSSWQKQHRRT
ncbi:hypothetical protein D3C72_1906450 [compost metagenome]